ncbi:MULTISPECIES: hypothetical protein [unclassified Helicobacter]|uniref:hypothetical protein n=1 Tax=unclassified Helicobacter TaxID=2593540 RepID=UPI0011C07D73|nr:MULTISPECIES: hypothetical protein [unclassified Helicobacter]
MSRVFSYTTLLSLCAFQILHAHNADSQSLENLNRGGGNTAFKAKSMTSFLRKIQQSRILKACKIL